MQFHLQKFYIFLKYFSKSKQHKIYYNKQNQKNSIDKSVFIGEANVKIQNHMKVPLIIY